MFAFRIKVKEHESHVEASIQFAGEQPLDDREVNWGMDLHKELKAALASVASATSKPLRVHSEMDSLSG